MAVRLYLGLEQPAKCAGQLLDHCLTPAGSATNSRYCHRGRSGVQVYVGVEGWGECAKSLLSEAMALCGFSEVIWFLWPQSWFQVASYLVKICFIVGSV